jgi:hypothetical protein
MALLPGFVPIVAPIAGAALNSASAIVGAMRLWALFNELEAVLRTGPVPDVTERVQAIAEEYKRAEAALRIWYAGC